MELKKVNTIKEMLIYMLIKKPKSTLVILGVVTALIILALRLDISCERTTDRNGKTHWNFKVQMKNMDSKIPVKRIK